jgi:hypothetical protein
LWLGAIVYLPAVVWLVWEKWREKAAPTAVSADPASD